MDNLEKGDNNLLSSLAKGGTLVIFGMVISKILTYFYNIVLARSLGPGDYGLITLGLSVIGLITSLAILGLPQGIIIYIASYKSKEDNKSINSVISSSLAISLILAIVLTVISFIFAEKIAVNIFHNSDLILVLKIFSFLIPLEVLVTHLESFVKGFRRIKYFVLVRQIIENSIKFGLTALALFLGFKVAGVVGVIIITSFISCILLLFFLYKKIFKFSIVKPDKIKMLLTFSLPLLLGQILITFTGWMDTLFLGYLKTTTDVGIYNIALSTSNLISVIPHAFFVLFLPMIIELYTKSQNITNLYHTVAKWIFFINLPILAILLIFPKQIITILFGSAYESGFLVLAILSISFIIFNYSLTSREVLLMLKKTKLIFLNTIVVFALNLILNLILIPKYGIYGAAIATGISYIIHAILIQIEFFKFTKISPIQLNYIKSIIATLLPIPFIYLFLKLTDMQSQILEGIICLVIFSVVYISILFLLKSFDEGEKELFKKLKSRLFKK